MYTGPACGVSFPATCLLHNIDRNTCGICSTDTTHSMYILNSHIPLLTKVRNKTADICSGSRRSWTSLIEVGSQECVPWAQRKKPGSRSFASCSPWLFVLTRMHQNAPNTLPGCIKPSIQQLSMSEMKEILYIADHFHTDNVSCASGSVGEDRRNKIFYSLFIWHFLDSHAWVPHVHRLHSQSYKHLSQC